MSNFALVLPGVPRTFGEDCRFKIIASVTKAVLLCRKISLFKEPITWRISSRAEILLRLHDEFQPRCQTWKCEEKRQTLSLSMSKLTFQSELKFEYDYMRFFWISAPAEMSARLPEQIFSKRRLRLHEESFSPGWISGAYSGRIHGQWLSFSVKVIIELFLCWEQEVINY